MSENEKSISVLCLGAGNMVSSIVPLIKKSNGFLDFTIYTPSGTRAEKLAKHVDGEVLNSLDCNRKFDWIILGFKPQHFDDAVSSFVSLIDKETVVISLLAGKKISTIQDSLNTKNVCRLMPNIPSRVAHGANLLSFSPTFGLNEKPDVFSCFDSLGYLLELDEDQLDLATPFSGSGPAYYYLFTEILSDILKEKGFSDKNASDLIMHTFIGAAKLLEHSGLPPSELRSQVTSKGGVTHAVVHDMISSELENLFRNSLEKGIDRNKELNN